MSTETIGTAQTFATIADWSASIPASLLEDEVGVLNVNEVYAAATNQDLNFSGVALNGFTITLRAAPGVMHDGDFGTGARIEKSSVGGSIYEPKNITIEDIELTNTSISGSAGGRVLRNSSDLIMRRCILKTGVTGSNSHVADILTGTNIIEACRVVGPNAGSSAGIFDVSGTATLHNVTSSDNFTGFSISTTTAPVQNCVATNCTTDYTGTYNGTTTNNASEDGTAPGTSSVTIVGDPFDPDGYTPAASGQLDGAGVDLSITLDAANNVFAGPPSIGAYEVIGAGPTVPVLSNATLPVYTP